MDCVQNPWQRPLLAQPGPRRLAIHWACRSFLNSRSSRPATSLLWAATLASGEITPILEIRHWAWARTMQALRSLLYCPVTTPNFNLQIFSPSSDGQSSRVVILLFLLQYFYFVPNPPPQQTLAVKHLVDDISCVSASLKDISAVLTLNRHRGKPASWIGLVHLMLCHIIHIGKRH